MEVIEPWLSRLSAGTVLNASKEHSVFLGRSEWCQLTFVLPISGSAMCL